MQIIATVSLTTLSYCTNNDNVEVAFESSLILWSTANVQHESDMLNFAP